MTQGDCPLLLECSRALSNIEKQAAPKQRVNKIGGVCAVCFVPEFYGYDK
jgi:hypothetical protein